MKERVFNYLSCVALAVPIALFSRCEAVVAMTDPPFEGVVGAFVAMLKGKAYLYNIRDMYPDMAGGGTLARPGFFGAALGKKVTRGRNARQCLLVTGEEMQQSICGVRDAAE